MNSVCLFQLKGMTLEVAQSQSLSLLERLNILESKDESVNYLSGGIKRKLSLAIALVGNPEVRNGS